MSPWCLDINCAALTTDKSRLKALEERLSLRLGLLALTRLTSLIAVADVELVILKALEPSRPLQTDCECRYAVQ